MNKLDNINININNVDERKNNVYLMPWESGSLGEISDDLLFHKREKQNDEDPPITWSKLPDEDADYADWKIDVVIQQPTDDGGDNEKQDITMVETKRKTSSSTIVVATYAVHRLPLGEKSKYFKGLFNNTFSETHNHRSTIELPSPAITCVQFEIVLDYLYHKRLMKSQSYDPVAMIYFGDYFCIKPLKEFGQRNVRAALFIDKMGSGSDFLMYSEKFATFFPAAKQLGMNDLQEAIIYTCACQWQFMSRGTELFKMNDLQFWHNVLLKRRQIFGIIDDEQKYDIKCWSVNVAYFIEHHFNDIDNEIFCAFTTVEALPYISPEVAITLMQQEHHFGKIEINEQDSNTLTCLQKRCIDALYNKETGEWQVEIDQELKQGRLRKISPIVLETLLLQTVKFAHSKQPPYPDSITVLEAGSECVNGDYDISYMQHEHPTYTKIGSYNGDTGLFRIHLLNKHKPNFAISFFRFLSPEGQDLDADDQDLYRDIDEDNPIHLYGHSSTRALFCFETHENERMGRCCGPFSPGPRLSLNY